MKGEQIIKKDAAARCREEFPYLYETHLHTKEISACAHSEAADMARACKAAGYTGIFVTDHNWHGNTAVDKNLPWEEFVEQFSKGYETAKTVGEEIGLDVFFGWEAGYDGTEFLIYGLSKEWLLATPQIRDASIAEQLALVHEGGGMVIHAHPFREEDYIPEVRLFPELVDGVEAVNATHSCHLSVSHNKKEFDEKALAYARKYRFPITGGSDVHSAALLGGGMAFRRKLRNGRDFAEAVLGGEEYVLTNGDEWFDKNGEKLF